VRAELPRHARLGYYLVHFPGGDPRRAEAFVTNLRRDLARPGKLRFEVRDLELQARDSTTSAAYRFAPARSERGFPGLPETGGGGAPPTAYNACRRSHSRSLPPPNVRHPASGPNPA
jgi:hypothetical protein